jgi:hypothetical protein
MIKDKLTGFLYLLGIVTISIIGIKQRATEKELDYNKNIIKTLQEKNKVELDSIVKFQKMKTDSMHFILQKERMDCMMRVEKAKQYIGTPYKWGGMSRSGVDCSGLMCLSGSKKASKRLLSLRTAKTMFRKLKSITYPVKGNLVFFSMNGKGVDHVGLLTSKNKFIHSSRSRGVVEDVLVKYKAKIVGYKSV